MCARPSLRVTPAALLIADDKILRMRREYWEQTEERIVIIEARFISF